MTAVSHKSPPPPCAIVIFGANGDLTKRLIVPALYNLARTGLLPPRLALIGVGVLVDAHGYGPPFLVLAGLDLVAAAAVLLARPVRPPAAAPAVASVP